MSILFDQLLEALALDEDIESTNDNLFYKAYDAYEGYMDPILADLGYTEDNCESLKDIPSDVKKEAFSLWLKEMRERAAWNDQMPSAVYNIIDLVDSSNLGESLNESYDSMWIIIPTERRYDDLTASDYLKFARKYGTFHNQKDCFDRIVELAPDRWDAFIPMKLEGVNESCNKELKEDAYDGKGPTVYVNNRSVLKINRDEDWQGSEYFDDLDYYGPFVPKKEFIVDIKDETGSSLSYEALCDYLLSNEDNIYHLKFKNSSLNEGWVEIEDDYGHNFFYNNEWFARSDATDLTISSLPDKKFSVSDNVHTSYGGFKEKTFNSFEEAKRYAKYLYKRYFLNESLKGYNSLDRNHLDPYIDESCSKGLKEGFNNIDIINKKIIASCDPESTLIEVLNACGGNLNWTASDLGLTVDELKFAIKFYGLDQEFDSFGESLKEDYLDPYIDELAEPLSKYMQMSSKHFNAVCDYIDDELRKPGRGLSELSKRDLETLYSVFIEQSEDSLDN